MTSPDPHVAKFPAGLVMFGFGPDDDCGLTALDDRSDSSSATIFILAAHGEPH